MIHVVDHTTYINTHVQTYLEEGEQRLVVFDLLPELLERLPVAQAGGELLAARGEGLHLVRHLHQQRHRLLPPEAGPVLFGVGW